MIELLSPAGSPEGVIAAVQNGADAVYMGMGAFNARRGAKNFTDEEFVKAVRYCHVRGCKVYVTLNTLVNDREMRDAVAAAKLASDAGADALIVKPAGPYSDIIRLVREHVDVPLCAYQVSGEYSMIRAAGLNGWIDERAVMLESLQGLKRAGADMLITYFAEEILRQRLAR